jgi:hypothetical protein
MKAFAVVAKVSGDHESGARAKPCTAWSVPHSTAHGCTRVRRRSISQRLRSARSRSSFDLLGEHARPGRLCGPQPWSSVRQMRQIEWPATRFQGCEHPPRMQILGLTQHHACGLQSFVFGGHASSPFFFLITGDFVD